MKPILYSPTETNFDNQGLGTLSDAISCTVSEERNGSYELELKYPFDGIHFSEIRHSSIIKAKPYDNAGLQLFRVYKITSPLNKVCTICAEHISYQLNYIPVMPFEAYDILSAFDGITTHMTEQCPFTFWTDIQSAAVYRQEEPEVVRARLGGQEGSFLDVYGGEYEWDNYTVKLHQQRGMDRDVTLRYGKNITDISQEESIANTYTGVVPFWIGDVIDDDAKAQLEQEKDDLEASIASLDSQIETQTTKVNRAKTAWNNAKTKYGASSAQAKKKKKAYQNQKTILNNLKKGKEDATVRLEEVEKEIDSVEGTKFEVCVTLEEQTLYADEAENFPFQRVRALDLSEKFEERPTEADLRSMARAWMDANDFGEPDINLKVSFVALWDTEEYKDVAPLERVRLCDTVVVEFERLNIRVAAKVTGYKYDVLLERYESITLGNAKKTLASSMADNHNLMLDVVEQIPKSSDMQAEIERATKLINGGYGGYVVFTPNANGQPEEILIMDEPTVAEATNVIRMNKNGIGFSTSGYEGPYATAWTIDSHFVADYITAGTMSANRIRAGLITDYANSTWAKTTDVSIDPNKSYYTRSGTSPNYVYTPVASPVVANIGTYYELKPSPNANYWNLTTGEFRLMATSTKVGNQTLASYVDGIADTSASSAASSAVSAYDSSLNQQAVFNKLTQNGTKQGIIMDSSGNLYINASYIQGTTINGVNLISEENYSSSTRYSRTYISPGKTIIQQKDYSSDSWYDSGWIGPTEKASGIIGSHQYGIEIYAGPLGLFLESSNKVYSQTTYNNTSSSAANMFIGSAGGFNRSTASSRRYKHDIRDIGGDLSPEKLLDVKVRSFKYNEDYISDEDERYLVDVPGFIAEELDEIYPIAVDHGKDSDGNTTCEDWNFRCIIPPMLALIQEQHKRIEALEKEMEILKNKIGE